MREGAGLPQAGGLGTSIQSPPKCPTYTPPEALQDKVAEVETRLREQLLETERRLNEARREHSKAGETCQMGKGFRGKDSVPRVCRSLSGCVKLPNRHL